MKITMLTALAATAAAMTVGLAATAHADTPVNVTVTDAVRAQLAEAAASLKGMHASDFRGLQPGMTYYAFDPDTQTYWAGATLMPGPSLQSQVSLQDAGSYTLLEQPKGGTWKAFNDGASDEPAGCRAPLPAAIIVLWRWDPQWCAPMSG